MRWPSEASERCAALAAIADLITDLAKEDLLHLLRSLEFTLLERQAAQAADVQAMPRRPPPLFERPPPPKPPSPPKAPPQAPQPQAEAASSSSSSSSSEGPSAAELLKQKKKDAAALEAIYELCAVHAERPWQVDGSIHTENFRRPLSKEHGHKRKSQLKAQQAVI